MLIYVIIKLYCKNTVKYTPYGYIGSVITTVKFCYIFKTYQQIQLYIKYIIKSSNYHTIYIYLHILSYILNITKQK